MPPEVPPILHALLAHRWNIAVLAELRRSSGAKFVTLAMRLGISRASLTKSLRYLVAHGLVRRNTGYGHPLRPEYLLTPGGTALATECQSLDAWVREENAAKVAYAKWSLPLLLLLGSGECRFNALRAALGDITPRAQTLALKALEDAGWIVRHIDRGYPPVVTYAVSPSGRKLQRVLRKFAAAG
jgi:DNA-binding HxlR family transcriptional regulator